MPTYEYRCAQGHSFEIIQKMSDDPVELCETCALPVRRVLFPVAVHFKGKGFYSTDYGSKRRNRELREAGEGSGKQEQGEGGGSSTESGGDSGGESGASKDGGSSGSESKTEKKTEQDKGAGKQKAGAAEG